MRKLLSTITLLSGLFAATAAADQTSFGAGLGALYNGVGINLARMNGADFKYAALGCGNLGYSSRNGTLSNCGIGAGWLRSDILGKTGRHGLGIHLGITYNTHENRDRIEMFVGLPYAYFFNGMDTAGLNLGLTPYLGRHNDENRAGFLLNLGYQF